MLLERCLLEKIGRLGELSTKLAGRGRGVALIVERVSIVEDGEPGEGGEFAADGSGVLRVEKKPPSLALLGDLGGLSTVVDELRRNKNPEIASEAWRRSFPRPVPVDDFSELVGFCSGVAGVAMTAGGGWLFWNPS